MSLATTGSLQTSGTTPARADRLRSIRRVAVGATTLLVIYAFLSAGYVPAVVAGALPPALVVLVPTSPWLSRRIAVNGLLLLASVPCLWWFRWPGHVDHGAVVVAVGAAWLTSRLFGAAPASRVRPLVPVATRSDLLVVVGVVLAAVATHRWWAVGSPHQALTTLLRGYDNSAHFNIFSKMLTHGATLDSLGRAPDGSAWSLVDYPQGFHAVAASYAELTSPGTTSGPDALVAYSHCIAAVVVLGTVVLVAAVCSLPGVRARPLVAAPTVVVVLTAFLWGPGANVLLDGFVNFWLAAVAAACALVLAVDTPRRLSPVHWAALGAAFVVVAHSWAPLLLLAGPAAVVALPVRGHAVRSDRRRRVLTALVAVLTALGILRAAWLLLHVADVRDVVTAHGGITSPSPVPTMVLVPLSLLVFVELGLWVRRSPDLSGHAVLGVVVRRLSLATLAGVTSLAGLLVLQLRSGGAAYYFFKYLVGFELVIGAVTAAAAGVLFSLCLPVLRTRFRGAALASLGVCLIATQAFGHVGWWDVLLAASPSHDNRADPPPSLSDVASGILVAASRVSTATAPYTYYLAPTSSRTRADVLPAVWVHALKGGMTTRQDDTQGCLAASIKAPRELTSCSRAILDSEPQARLLVRPTQVAALRSSLGHGLASRIETWSRSTSVQAQGER